MTKKEKDRKTALMKEIEGLIDEMLKKKSAPHEIDLREIEQTAIKTGEKIKQVITQSLLEDGEQRAAEVYCPECQKKLGMKDYRSRQVVTEAGEVRLRRAYYYCGECKQGIFPPG